MYNRVESLYSEDVAIYFKKEKLKNKIKNIFCYSVFNYFLFVKIIIFLRVRWRYGEGGESDTSE